MVLNYTDNQMDEQFLGIYSSETGMRCGDLEAKNETEN